MSRQLVHGLVIILLVFSPIGAIAGELRVSGNTLIFDAGIGEVNKIVVNGRGSVFDQSTGQFVTGLTVVDSVTAMVVQAPCRKISGTALCDGSSITRVVINLGNKDDSVKQDFSVDQGSPVPMTVDGGLGVDTITGGPLGDILNGGAGNDIIDGGNGNDSIDGGLGDDTITGGAGADTLKGDAGGDTIDARDGQVDTINCGLGRDTLLRDPNDVFSRCEK